MAAYHTSERDAPQRSAHWLTNDHVPYSFTLKYPVITNYEYRYQRFHERKRALFALTMAEKEGIIFG